MMKIASRAMALLCLVFTTTNVLSQINTPSGATRPFGSNTSYDYGIMPTNLPTSGTYGQSSEVATLYNQWKSTYVENCGSDKARVKFDNTSETVSEGIAYGMLLAAYAADKDLFDRLWAYYKNFRNHNGVMHWKINGCNSVNSQNGATDAELDAAMALIVAHVQWPTSTSPHNYTNDCVALINAIKDHETAGDGTFYNGDMWHPDCRNPSYQAPAYARAFKQFMADNGQNQDSFWDNVASGTENLFKNNAHATSGLSTNWCTPAGPPSPSCSGSGTAPDKFGYDACRAPWRQGVDVLWWGPSNTGSVQDVIDRQANFWINKGGATTVQGSNNMNHDGSGSGDHNGAYTGPIGAMALGATNTTAHQNFANALYTENKKTSIANGYFTEILQMIGLFVQTGNFWNPYGSNSGGSNEDPTVSLTAPTNGLTVCEGENITLSANASDTDGSISKVEFYSGNTLLGSDNTSPYTYNWTVTGSGTQTLTAKAFDDKNASTTSAGRSITIETVNAPSVSSPIIYSKGETATQLSATGTNLKWYTSANGGSGSTSAPVPSTTNEGSTSYYVSQTSGNGCESDRAEIVVTVIDVLLIERATSAPVIDGTIDNVWTQVSGEEFTNMIQGSISNNSDLSGSFKALWDDAYFYVLGEITDDNLSSDSGPVYEDDGIEIYFDFGNDKNGAYGNDDSQFTFRWDDNTVSVNPTNHSTSGIDFDMSTTVSGYTFEARIPWSTLGGTGQAGDIHGFDFHVNDDDNGGTRDGKLSWNAPTDDAWQDTQLFGLIKLNAAVTAIEPVNNSTFVVYPNPFVNTLTVKGLKGESSYTISDMHGEVVQTGTTTGNIQAELNAGVYILSIEGSNVRIVKID